MKKDEKSVVVEAQDDTTSRDMKKFADAFKRFHKSSKEIGDYVTFLQSFENCCGQATWGEIRATIHYNLMDMSIGK
jgi:hypothetical protein